MYKSSWINSDLHQGIKRHCCSQKSFHNNHRTGLSGLESPLLQPIQDILHMMLQYNIGLHLRPLLRQVSQNMSYSGIHGLLMMIMNHRQWVLKSLAWARIPITGRAFNSIVSGFMESKYTLRVNTSARFKIQSINIINLRVRVRPSRRSKRVKVDNRSKVDGPFKSKRSRAVTIHFRFDPQFYVF